MKNVIPLVLLYAYVGRLIDAVPTAETTAGMAYNTSCTNPDQHAGRCVHVRECKIVLTTLRKEILTDTDVAFLYQSECGKLERKTLVCCPDYSITHQHIENRRPGRPSGGHGPYNHGSSSSSHGDHPTKPGGDSGDKLDQWKLLPKPGECGTQPSYQFFGENVTKIDEQPWTALLHLGNMPYETTFKCGGALISSRYVLTAAHCVVDSNEWSNLTIRLGEWDTESTVDCVSIEDFSEFYCADPAIDVPVEKVLIHEQYSSQHRPQLNDIALLRLANPVESTTWIRPICLSERPILAKDAEEVFTLAGWGNNGCGFTSRYKVRSKLNALSQEQCKKNLPTGFRKAHDFLCTVPVTEGDKCHADSGGALTSTRHVSGVGVVHELAGILNHMRECDASRPMGIFANVGRYVEWIVSKLEE